MKPANQSGMSLSTADDDRRFVHDQVFPDSTAAELQLYLHDCKRHGIHPLDRLIHPTITTANGRRRYTPITSIDLLRSRAESTGSCAGIDDPVFAGEPGSNEFRATVTVWRLVQGQRCPWSATARWSEYKPDKDFMWRKKPHTMLGKCAEALALRRAFPAQLAGLYAREEMEQSDSPLVAPALPAEAEMRAAVRATVEIALSDGAEQLLAALWQIEDRDELVAWICDVRADVPEPERPQLQRAFSERCTALGYDAAARQDLIEEARAGTASSFSEMRGAK